MELKYEQAQLESRCVPQDDGVAGPNSELEWWKSRLSRLSHIKVQLKTQAAKATVGVCMATRSKTSKRWHDVEFKVNGLWGALRWGGRFLLP